ncbi:MAG TPA: hypothetical protein VFQ27_05025 [Xanthobacteraceae bacterium]|nr:hypothetical protein [Xanthobacteraceae bacterium]
MGTLAVGILVAMLVGAVASWIVAAVYAARALAVIEGPGRGGLRRLAIVAWPFATARFRGQASRDVAIVNKAIVAFFVFATLAVTTVSLATNLNRITP